jgi:hypothetical protein
MTIEKADSIRRPPHNPTLEKIPQARKAIFPLSGLRVSKFRIVNMDGDPWFIAKDVCEALEADHNHRIEAIRCR